MNYTKPGAIVKCHNCDFTGTEDYFVVRDFGNYDVDFLCRPCESKLPKTDPRDWREDETVLTFPDGSQMKISQETGMLEDVDAVDSEQAEIARRVSQTMDVFYGSDQTTCDECLEHAHCICPEGGGVHNICYACYEKQMVKEITAEIKGERDADATNILLQKDDRVSTEIESHAIRAAGYFALACVGMFIGICFLLEGK